MRFKFQKGNIYCATHIMTLECPVTNEGLKYLASLKTNNKSILYPQFTIPF